MSSQPLQPELVLRLRSAEGHLRGIIGMIEADADCQDIVLQVLAVQGALREVNRLVTRHFSMSACAPRCRVQMERAANEHSPACGEPHDLSIEHVSLFFLSAGTGRCTAGRVKTPGRTQRRLKRIGMGK